eukprot:gene5422-7511_t
MLAESLISTDENVGVLNITPLMYNKYNGSLRVVLVASGSRGDIQPYIALGIHLKQRGHQVTVATELRMKSLVDSFNLQYAPIAGDPTGVLFETSAQEALKSGSLFKLMKLTEDWNKKFQMSEILSSFVVACEGADVIISAGLTMTQTYCVAEMKNCKWIPMILGPTLPTSEFPIWPLASFIPCRCLNKWSYNFLFKTLWASESKFINPWRENELKLKPIKAARGIVDLIETQTPPIIIACSSKICGVKRTIPSDYPVNAHMNGFVFVASASDKDIDGKLVEFIRYDPLKAESNNENMLTGTINVTIADNRPIVYFGFGSMPTTNPVEFLKLAIDVCTEINCRAVIVAGWSELSSDECQQLIESYINNRTIIVVQSVPHDWLFPRMNCIVHHCGVGTMAAALRSGIPQIPCPVILDQPHNAKIIVSLGCANTFIPFTKLTAKKIVDQLFRIFSNEGNIKENAAKIGEEVRFESGASLDYYCDVIEAYASTPNNW